MIKSIRINNVESEALESWMKRNRPKMIEPFTCSEIIHVLIMCGLQRLEVNERGELYYKIPKTGQG